MQRIADGDVIEEFDTLAIVEQTKDDGAEFVADAAVVSGRVGRSQRPARQSSQQAERGLFERECQSSQTGSALSSLRLDSP